MSTNLWSSQAFRFAERKKTVAAVEMFSALKFGACQNCFLFSHSHTASLSRWVENNFWSRNFFAASELWHFQVFFCFSYANFLDILLLQNQGYGRLLSTEPIISLCTFCQCKKILITFLIPLVTCGISQLRCSSYLFDEISWHAEIIVFFDSITKLETNLADFRVLADLTRP